MLVCIAGRAVACPDLAQAASDRSATVTSPDGVNLRAGPGTSHPILAVLPHGTIVTVTGEAVADNWIPVAHAGKSGFVKGEYVSWIDTVATRPVSSPQRSQPAHALVLPPDGLNVRQGPSITYPVVTVVPGGAEVQVIGQPTPDGWRSIMYEGKVGWVDGNYLSVGAPSSLQVTGGASASGPPPALSRFIWPVQSRLISTRFSTDHQAIDIDEMNGGNPVVAAAAGTVTFAGGDSCCSYGLYVIITHTDGYTSLYSHFASISVRAGQEVKQGALLGTSGCTGFCTGPNLHLEVRKDGVLVDPISVLPSP